MCIETHTPLHIPIFYTKVAWKELPLSNNVDCFALAYCTIPTHIAVLCCHCRYFLLCDIEYFIRSFIHSFKKHKEGAKGPYNTIPIGL